MTINNENEIYILHFIFHSLYSTYQIIKDTCNEKHQNNISTCEETRNMIHDYSSKKFQIYIDDLI